MRSSYTIRVFTVLFGILPASILFYHAVILVAISLSSICSGGISRANLTGLVWSGCGIAGFVALCTLLFRRDLQSFSCGAASRYVFSLSVAIIAAWPVSLIGDIWWWRLWVQTPMVTAGVLIVVILKHINPSRLTRR